MLRHFGWDLSPTFPARPFPALDPLLEAFQAEIVATGCCDWALRKLHAEDAAEVLADDLEGIVHRVVVVSGGVGGGAGEEGLAAARLLLVGEGLVGLDGADGGDEAVPGSGGCRGGRGSGVVGGAVGAAPLGGVGEGRGLGEARGVPWRGAGGASEEINLGRGGGVADHADAISVAGEVRHGGGGGEEVLGWCWG